MNTDKHRLKKTFCCFKKIILVGTGIRDYQCKSVANSGDLVA